MSSNTLLSIRTNVASLRAQRQLATSTTALSSSFERLSSGSRINKASDDAAGLAVSTSLKADTRIYSQGIRNLNDGVSALNIADGALSNLSSIVTRLQELAEQSANGAVSATQRKSLDAEAQALAKEYFRISRTTAFNGLKLFDGSLQGLSLQAGYGDEGSILSSLGGALGTGTFARAVSYATQTTGGLARSQAVALADLNGDASLDLVTAGLIGNGPTEGQITISFGNGDGSFGGAITYSSEGTTSNALALADVNNDGVIDIATAGESNGSGAATIRLGNGDGTFRRVLSYQTEAGRSSAISMSDVNNDGALDMITAGSDGGGRATIRLGYGDGTFKAAFSYETEIASFNGTRALSLSDLNGDGLLDLVTAGDSSMVAFTTIRLGNGDGSFRRALSYSAGNFSFTYGVSVTDLNGDGNSDLAAAGGGGGGGVSIRLGNGDGTFGASLSYQTESSSSYALTAADLDGNGILDLVTAGVGGGFGSVSVCLGNGDGTFQRSLSYSSESSHSAGVATADLNNDGVQDLISAGVSTRGKATIRLANTREGISPILPFSLETQADALQAIPLFNKTRDRLSMQRGQVGAFQSRLVSALSTLGSTTLEYQSAQGRVADVDVASESANLMRQRILQQSASSILAHANNGLDLALSLLVE